MSCSGKMMQIVNMTEKKEEKPTLDLLEHIAAEGAPPVHLKINHT